MQVSIFSTLFVGKYDVLIIFQHSAFMKEKILHTALEQFLKYGIREMSIKKLIEPLGISTKTVYKFYKNKEELLEEVLHLQYAQQFQQIENRYAYQDVVSLFFDIWHLAIERGSDVNDVFYRDLQHYYPELEIKIEEAIGEKFANKLLQIIQKGITEGVFEEEILPEVVMEGIYILYDAYVRAEKFRNFNATPYEIYLNTIVLNIKGICTPKGLKILEEHMSSTKESDRGKIKFTSK